MAHKQINDLEKAFKILDFKGPLYTELFKYYDGDQELKYNRDRFQDIFQNLNTDFTENWSAVVIDATYNRVNLIGVTIASDDKDGRESGILAALKRIASRLTGGVTNQQERLNTIIEENEVLLESDDVHKVAGIIGESFYIVWADKPGDPPKGFYNDPRMVHIFYEEENPRIKKFAAKWWIDDRGYRRLVLYYPDRLERFVSQGKAKTVRNHSAFMPSDEDGRQVTGIDDNVFDNPFDKIPVFHFRPDRRLIKSDLKNVIPPQDAVNKLASDMMITSEFMALPQRYIISNVDIKGKLKNAPNINWDIPAGDGEGQETEVGELSAADPTNYLKPIEHNIAAISSITSTPFHFFIPGGTSQISGEALIALEAPLNDKAQARIDLFQPVWRDVFSFMLEIANQKVDPINILVAFEPPETLQPRTRAEIREINVRSGIPLVTTLRDEGWSQSRIDQLIVDIDEQRQARQASLGAALLRSQREFDNSEDDDHE